MKRFIIVLACIIFVPKLNAGYIDPSVSNIYAVVLAPVFILLSIFGKAIKEWLLLAWRYVYKRGKTEG